MEIVDWQRTFANAGVAWTMCRALFGAIQKNYSGYVAGTSLHTYELQHESSSHQVVELGQRTHVHVPIAEGPRGWCSPCAKRCAYQLPSSRCEFTVCDSLEFCLWELASHGSCFDGEVGNRRLYKTSVLYIRYREKKRDAEMPRARPELSLIARTSGCHYGGLQPCFEGRVQLHAFHNS